MQIQFENFLKKLALDTLKMTSDEYQQLTRGHNQDWIINELEKRSLERGLVSYNLRTLLESLQKDQIFASKTHNEWGPPEVRTILMTPYSDTNRGKSTELKAFHSKGDALFSFTFNPIVFYVLANCSLIKPKEMYAASILSRPGLFTDEFK